ncbi:MAG: outer membrane beta-barrel protein [Pseudomonadota bacterium]
MLRAAFGALFALSLALPAARAEEAPTAFEGFYGGLQAGVSGTDVTLVLNGDDFDEMTTLGAEGGAFAGYALRRGRFVGGVELDAGVAGGSDRAEAPGLTLELSQRAAFGVSAIAGVIVAGQDPEGTRDGGEVLLYARAGYRGLLAEVDAGGDSATDVFHGLRVGAGVGYALTDRLSLRAEYSRLEYRDGSYGRGRSTLRVGPSGNLVSVGVRFAF